MEHHVPSRPIGEVLSDDDIWMLEYWKNSRPKTKSFLKSECMGCSYKIEQLQPIYRVDKGKYIHFGLQDELGIQNWVFKKKRGVVNQFYTFQGDSQEELQEQSQDKQRMDYILEGVFPTTITSKNIYLTHINHNIYTNEHWYQTVFPTEIEYEVDLRNRTPVKFKFNSGLYSYQKPDENGRNPIINFIETFFYPIMGNGDQSISYESLTDGYYANTSFFMCSLQEKADVSIQIESNLESKDFNFSVFKNKGFHTIVEYLNRKGKQYTQYKKRLKEGEYLIRIIHENADYMETPLYTVNIEKQNVD